MFGTRVWPFAISALLLTGCLLTAAVPAAAEDDDNTPQVPDWTLRCADGSEVNFHEALAKGPVIVSFWATWCRPCLKELPHLSALARETAGRLTVLAVNIDSSKSVAKVRPFLAANKYDFIVPLDTAGDLSRMMQVGNMVPFLVLYGSTGCELYRHVGYKPGDEVELERIVLELLEPSTAEGEE
ncbi:MAG: TlpA disulfide reductase family protein [bacterium]